MIGRGKIWVSAVVLILPLAIAAEVSIALARADGSPAIAGNWARDDGGTRIAISPCGAALCAVNTWVKNPEGKEHVGDKLILTLQPVSSAELQGQAYDVRRDLHFKMTITLNGGNAMQTSGCVFLGVICKNAGWTRTD